MNVLHLISSGGMYGAEAVILGLSHQLTRHRDRSSVAVFANASLALHDRALEEGLPALKIPCRSQVDPATLQGIRDAVRWSEADVVHAHGYKADMYALLALRKQRIALVSTCHTWYDNDAALRVYGVLDRWALRRFSRVVAVSTEVEQQLRRSGVRADRIRRIYNGVAMPEPKAWPEASAGLHVGLVGRLSPEKGIDTFLESASLVARTMPETRFTVFGEGPERSALEATIVRLKLHGIARLAGRTEDMHAAYRSLDLLVSASRQEGLPMALLEGMAHGLPVVGTTVGEVPMLVRDHEDGRLVPPGNPDALGEAMVAMLQDAPLRQQYGASARQRIEQDFSVEHMTEAYRTVYQEAIGEAGL